MTPPRLIALLLVALAVAACGGSETRSTRFIAQSTAERFQTTLASAESNLDEGNCDTALDRIAGLRGQVDGWPDAYDARLEANVRAWIDYLEERVPADCGVEETPTPTETPDPELTPEPTPEESPEPTPEETPEETPSPEATPEIPDTPDAIPTPDGGGSPPTGGAPGEEG